MNPNYRKPRAKKTKDTSIIVNQLNVQSADRTRKDIASFRMALINAESVHNPNRSRLQDLYEDVILDGHLTGIVQKRIDQTCNKRLQFLDAQGKEVEGMDDLIESERFREIMRQVLESKFFGLSGLEFIPGPEIEFEEIPRKHIKIERKQIATWQNDTDGIDYEGISNIWVIGKKKDLGILLKCSPYAIWKRGAVADWSQYIEIFGQPVRIVKYDAYDQKTQSDVKRVLDESGSSLALMIPKQADFEMMDGKGTNANGQLQDSFRKACNEEMSVIVLGNTETTNSSKSSGYAQSLEHAEQQDEIILNDMLFLKSHLNSEHFLNILRSYGYPVDGGYFDWEDEISLAKLKLRLEIDKEVSTKVPFGDDYWYETYKVPKPDNYNELVKQMQESRAKSQDENTDEKAKSQKLKANSSEAKSQKPKANSSEADSQELKAQLTKWQEWMANLADFFDQARSK